MSAGGNIAAGGNFIPLNRKNPAVPVLSAFTIHTVYLGSFQDGDIATLTRFIADMAGYIRGDSAPNGQEPVVRQYGIVSAQPGISTTQAATGSHADDTDVAPLLKQLQRDGKLPAFDIDRLFLVITKGIDFNVGDCSWHDHDGTDGFYAVCPFPVLACAGNRQSLAPMNVWQGLIAHEVFEAATDPILNAGWMVAGSDTQEGADLCNRQFVDTAFGTLHAFTDNLSGGYDIWAPVGPVPPLVG